MAQLRRDYQKFRNLNTEVVVIVPNGPKMIERHINRHATPYPILSDKGAKITAQYGIDARQAVIFQVFTPTIFLVDRSGVIRYAHYGTSYIQEPDNGEPLAVLSKLLSDGLV
jgi:peroxiredoxin